MIIEKIQQVLMSADNTPFYLFDAQRFVDNIEKLRSCFGIYYGNHKVAYSLKTNASESVVRMAKSLRCYSEVVSPAEYNFAKSLWIEDKNIIYNGIIPDTENKVKCAINGGKVNIDNLNELLELNEYAMKLGVNINVGIRVFFGISENETSKFGFDINGSEFKYILEHNFSNITIAGLHCHISGHRSAEDWKTRMEVMILLSKKFKNIKYIDVGGNMYGDMDEQLRKQFDCAIPSFMDYAKQVALTMKQEYSKEDVELITENGTSLIGNCVDIVSRIIGVKQCNDKEMFICDTSIYDMGFLPKTKNVPYELLNVTHTYNNHKCDIVGYACTEEDILVRGYEGSIEVGDYIIFRNLGAYSCSLASDFIQPKPSFKQA